MGDVAGHMHQLSSRGIAVGGADAEPPATHAVLEWLASQQTLRAWSWHGIHWGLFLKVLESRLEASEYGGHGTNPRCPALMLFSSPDLMGRSCPPFLLWRAAPLGECCGSPPPPKKK